MELYNIHILKQRFETEFLKTRVTYASGHSCACMHVAVTANVFFLLAFSPPPILHPPIRSVCPSVPTATKHIHTIYVLQLD